MTPHEQRPEMLRSRLKNGTLRLRRDLKTLVVQRRRNLGPFLPAPIASGERPEGSGTVVPLSENVMLSVGGVAPPTISVPILQLVQACRSAKPVGNGVPGGTRLYSSKVSTFL